LFEEPESRAAVEATERFADEVIEKKELKTVTKRLQRLFVQRHNGAEQDAGLLAFDAANWLGSTGPLHQMVLFVARFCREAATSVAIARRDAERPIPSKSATRKRQAALLRDIFGNPFRRITLKSSWVTTTVKDLAHSIYDDRAFNRLPKLADALEDPGCTNTDILNHCRQRGKHVRGCWVVDLILGKE
jgi:hypothetical protein